MTSKPFSIYFPQFYSTPTNDSIWGKGFTDWTLLAHANILNRWDRRAPARGLYDGSDPEVHHLQMDEMHRYGLGGLALYHYWFFTHQELNAFEQTLMGMGPSTPLPWFLIWASEGWSKRWIGDHSATVGLSREPTRDDVEKHCDHLAQCFAHPTYLTCSGKPLFAWYNLSYFAHADKVIDSYRAAFQRRGVDPLLVHFIKSESDRLYCDLTDGAYLFEPRLFFSMQRIDRGQVAQKAFDIASAILGTDRAMRVLVATEKMRRSGSLHRANHFLDYLTSQKRQQFITSLLKPVQEVISPGWNNAPRYGQRYTALESLSTEQFRAALDLRTKANFPLLVNAWNEWTESAAIEPCAYYGTRYLDALPASSCV